MRWRCNRFLTLPVYISRVFFSSFRAAAGRSCGCPTQSAGSISGGRVCLSQPSIPSVRSHSTMAHHHHLSGRTWNLLAPIFLMSVTCGFCLLSRPVSAGNPDAKRLYDDLLSNYNKIVRPVVNNSDVLTVRIKLKLSQLIDLVSVFFFVLLLRDAPL